MLLGGGKREREREVHVLVIIEDTWDQPFLSFIISYIEKLCSFRRPTTMNLSIANSPCMLLNRDIV